VDCVVAGQFPRFEARVPDGTRLGRATVHFHPEGASAWYAVAMKAEGQKLAGILPRPLKTLKSFTYYIEVTDAAMTSTRTAEHTTAVVDAAGACSGKMVAATVGSASVAVTAPAGAAPVPAGFATTGVAAAGSAAPVAAGAAAGGGGIGATALIIGGGAVAAGAVVAAKAAGGGDDGGSGGDGDGGSRGAVYSFLFEPMIDVSSCANRNLNWCCQNVNADANGNFNETWAPNEPNTLRISGQVTPTAVNATLSCISGSGNGSLSASGGGGTYRGTFQFGASRGAVTVTQIAR